MEIKYEVLKYIPYFILKPFSKILAPFLFGDPRIIYWMSFRILSVSKKAYKYIKKIFVNMKKRYLLLDSYCRKG